MNTAAPTNPISYNATPTAEEVADALHGAPHRTLDVSHSELACWSFGAGPDVVFIHGWPLNAATFRGWVPHLADRFTCHLLDLPGAGKTRWTAATPFGMWEHADTVRAAIDALGLARYATVSHDSGGTIARLLAARDPERTAGLVIGNTEIPGEHFPGAGLAKVLGRMPGASAALRLMLRSRKLRLSKNGFGGCFTDPRYAEGDFRAFTVDPLLADPHAMEGQMGLVRGLNWEVVHQLADVHARIKAPVKLIWGEKDHLFPLEKARGMVDQFGGEADLVVIPDGRLFAHEERVGEFVAEAGPFLERCLGVG